MSASRRPVAAGASPPQSTEHAQVELHAAWPSWRPRPHLRSLLRRSWIRSTGGADDRDPSISAAPGPALRGRSGCDSIGHGAAGCRMRIVFCVGPLRGQRAGVDEDEHPHGRDGGDRDGQGYGRVEQARQAIDRAAMSMPPARSRDSAQGCLPRGGIALARSSVAPRRGGPLPSAPPWRCPGSITSKRRGRSPSSRGVVGSWAQAGDEQQDLRPSAALWLAWRPPLKAGSSGSVLGCGFAGVGSGRLMTVTRAEVGIPAGRRNALVRRLYEEFPQVPAGFVADAVLRAWGDLMPVERAGRGGGRFSRGGARA
jgi:hypothetical protein